MLSAMLVHALYDDAMGNMPCLLLQPAVLHPFSFRQQLVKRTLLLLHTNILSNPTYVPTVAGCSKY